LLVLLKNSQHILLLTAKVFLGMIFTGSVFWPLLKRYSSLVKVMSLGPLRECWRSGPNRGDVKTYSDSER